MELSLLETTFFAQVLNAELDVPVLATLKYQQKDFEIIVVPEIAPEGYFRMRYFNAQESDPGTDDIGPLRGRNWEWFNSGPRLDEAWRNQDAVELQLHTLPRPMLPYRTNPSLRARILYAGNNRTGELVLLNNQVALQSSKLKTAKFCIRTLRDFATPEKQASSIEGITEAEYRTLASIAGKLGEGAKLTITPVQHNLILQTTDGWTITLTKDQAQPQGPANHTGVLKRDDGDGFTAAEVCDLLDGLRYFFTFTMGQYCLPTVAIGYAESGQLIWGEVAKFENDVAQPRNWFNHPREAPYGHILEELFPKFWSKWLAHKDEMIAALDAYANSNTMRTAGVLGDAVGKSFAGLELLCGLVLEQPIFGDSGKWIDKVLRCYKIPNRLLTCTEHPHTQRLLANLGIADDKGASLLADVRNYVVHPLGRSNHVVKRVI